MAVHFGRNTLDGTIIRREEYLIRGGEVKTYSTGKYSEENKKIVGETLEIEKYSKREILYRRYTP